MSKLSIQRHAKSSNLLELIKPEMIGVAVDESGSTKGDIFAQEIKMAKSVLGNDLPCVFWSDTARLCNNLQHISHDGGGTNPISIFQRSECAEYVYQRPVFCLVTDGHIPDQSVGEFANRAGTYLRSRALNIGVIFNFGPLNQYDISVMAPLTTAGPDCIILGFSAHGLRLLQVYGERIRQHIPQLPRKIDEKTEMYEMPKIDHLGQYLAKISVSTELFSLPADSIRLNETAEYVEFVNRNNLLDAMSCHSELEHLNWTSIFEAERVSGNLYRYRRRLEELNLQLDMGIPGPSESTKQQEQGLTDLKCQVDANPDDEKMKETYKARLANYMEETLKSRREYLRQSRPQRSFIQGLMSELHRIESASWNITEHGSNRSKRASTIPQAVTSIDELDVKCLEMECKICFDKKPAALLFIPGPSDEFYLEDFAINCPLACGYQASQKFCNIHVCIDCAVFFVHRGQDIYHRPVLGAWPIIRTEDCSPQVWNYCQTIVKQAFLGRKDLPHAMLLMFAAVEALGSHLWSATPEWLLIRKTLLPFLLKQTQTNATFDNSSTRVFSLLDAMKEITKDVRSREFNVKPLSMQLLIIRMGMEYEFIKNHDVLVAASTVSHLVSYIKAMSVSDRKAYKEEFIRKSYHTEFGIPIRGSIHDIPVEFVQLKNVLPSSTFTIIMHELLGYWKQNPDFFDKFKKEEMLQTLKTDREFFNLILSHSRIPRTGLMQVDKYWTGHNVHELGPDHGDTIPPFYLNLGPDSCADPLACADCNLSFLPNALFIHLDTLVDIVKENRSLHFAKVFGSHIPDKKSAHCNLHSTTAKVLSYAVSNENKNDLERVMTVLGKQCKGDIYHPKITQDVAQAVQSFRAIQKEEDFSSGLRSNVARRTKFKILCALYKRGYVQDHPKTLMNCEDFIVRL